MTDEVLEFCDRRREKKKHKHTSEESAREYSEANKVVRKKIEEAKENWISEQCRKIENGMKNGNSKAAFDTLKDLTRTQQNKSPIIENNTGEPLTDSAAILERWTEYCRDLYNYPISPDRNFLDKDENVKERTPSTLPVLREEVEEAIRSLPAGKSPGADNIPAELIKNGGEEVTKIITLICQKIWDTKEWPTAWTQSLVIPLPKKGNLRQCKNYRTISLIPHASKVMLRILLNRLKKQAEEHLAEEQAGFRAKRSTVEQIFNCRILIEKHLQHQNDLFHNFIDFKKAFDRVWHDGLWQVLRNFNIEEGLIQCIEALYQNASSAVFLGNQVGEYFKTPVGVRQGCLLSPVLFNLFLENIMRETLQNFTPSVSIGGRPLCNLRFADDIDLIAGNNQELQDLTDRLTSRATAHGMEVSCEKSKVLVNSDDKKANILMNGEQLEEVNNFKYLGATITKDGRSTDDVKTRLAIATSSMARLFKIWKSKDISFTSKFKLYKSLVLSTALYGCESWTLTTELEKRIQAFEMKCLRRLLNISWQERKTNEYVRETIQKKVGRQEELLSIVKKRKLEWFGHVTRHQTLSKTILQGTVPGARKRGRQRKSWMENIRDWTGRRENELIRIAEDRHAWRLLTRTSSKAPLRPARS